MDVQRSGRGNCVFRYVLEGSVRKAGNRVRITAQLIDGDSGHHLWAERYDRDLDDIFALQDEIARAIVDALKIRLMPAERAAIGKRTTENVEAYQYYLMGRQHFLRLGRRNHLSARRLYQRALEIDPEYARARAGLALAEGMLLRSGDPSANACHLARRGGAGAGIELDAGGSSRGRRDGAFPEGANRIRKCRLSTSNCTRSQSLRSAQNFGRRTAHGAQFCRGRARL